ncbi:MAG: HNH endonuclease [Actinomycetota bacterium]
MASGIAAAIEELEKGNADLQPELLSAERARELMAAYSRAEKLVAFGIAALSRRLSEAEVARFTGSSLVKARSVVATGAAMASSQELSAALQHGEVSLDQAVEIASAEQSSPGAARGLVAVAQEHPFHVLRDKARKAKLEAEQHRDLGARQHAARRARTYTGELGMVHIHLELEPHVGTPLVARAEAEAQRLSWEAKRADKSPHRQEPFECHLADAYAKLLSGAGSGRAKRPELVVLVSHEVAKRGWRDVRDGEVCKIPGVGPVAPETAREIAEDAFLSGVLYDGKDLRQLRRWTRNIPPEVMTALELGEPPGFDGVVCVDCGNRFRTEFDHVHPKAAGGATSHPNLKPRCWDCHQAKTKRDRKEGHLGSVTARAGPGP